MDEPTFSGPGSAGAYAIHHEIGRGGMATVHLGQHRSASGFRRIVAIKRMHPHLARTPEFVDVFLSEARLASRIQHPNVVAAFDLVATEGDAFFVMEYVHGLSLDHALCGAANTRGWIPLPVVSSILIGTLLGLHAAHQAVDEHGISLGIVHRDMSPHNVLVGADGLSRVLDFGIAKARERFSSVGSGEVKGKVGYLAPEQLFDDCVEREADIYAAGVMLWEMVARRRLFGAESHGQLLLRIANPPELMPPNVSPEMAGALNAIARKALAPLPENRFRTALEFATALERCMPPAPQRVVGEWVLAVAGDTLTRRAELKRMIEERPPSSLSDSRSFLLPTPVPQTVTTVMSYERTSVPDGAPDPSAIAAVGSRIFLGGLAVGAAGVLAATLAFSSHAVVRRTAASDTALAEGLSARPVVVEASPDAGAWVERSAALAAPPPAAGGIEATVGAAVSAEGQRAAAPSFGWAAQARPTGAAPAPLPHVDVHALAPKPRPFAPNVPPPNTQNLADLRLIGGRQ